MRSSKKIGVSKLDRGHWSKMVLDEEHHQALPNVHSSSEHSSATRTNASSSHRFPASTTPAKEDSRAAAKSRHSVLLPIQHDRPIPANKAGSHSCSEACRQVSNSWGSLAYWWPELLALLMAFVAFGSMVAVAAPFQDHPIPRWPYHITINAVIAVQSTLM